MRNEKTSDKPRTFLCHARRHMSGPVFKTYDAILAMAKSGPPEDRPFPDRLVFLGRIRPTLANHTNSSLTQLAEHIECLVEHKWLYRIDPPAGNRERDVRGHLQPVWYHVIEHAEYQSTFPDSCPEFLYGGDGARLKKGVKPVDFALAELEKTLPGKMALVAARLSGDLPGKDWDEIRANLRKNPEKMPDKPLRGKPGKE